MNRSMRIKIGWYALVIGFLFFTIGVLFIPSTELWKPIVIDCGLAWIVLSIYCLYERKDDGQS